LGSGGGGCDGRMNELEASNETKIRANNQRRPLTKTQPIQFAPQKAIESGTARKSECEPTTNQMGKGGEELTNKFFFVEPDARSRRRDQLTKPKRLMRHESAWMELLNDDVVEHIVRIMMDRGDYKGVISLCASSRHLRQLCLALRARHTPSNHQTFIPKSPPPSPSPPPHGSTSLLMRSSIEPSQSRISMFVTSLFLESMPSQYEALGRALQPRVPSESIIMQAHSFLIERDPYMCVLWAWLLAVQHHRCDVLFQHVGYVPDMRCLPMMLARRVVLNRVFRNDLLLWATSTSVNGMPPRASAVINNPRERPYFWRVACAYLSNHFQHHRFGFDPCQYFTFDACDQESAVGRIGHPNAQMASVPMNQMIEIDAAYQDRPMPPFVTVLSSIELRINMWHGKHQIDLPIGGFPYNVCFFHPHHRTNPYLFHHLGGSPDDVHEWFNNVLLRVLRYNNGNNNATTTSKTASLNPECLGQGIRQLNVRLFLRVSDPTIYLCASIIDPLRIVNPLFGHNYWAPNV